MLSEKKIVQGQIVTSLGSGMQGNKKYIMEKKDYRSKENSRYWHKRI